MLDTSLFNKSSAKALYLYEEVHKKMAGMLQLRADTQIRGALGMIISPRRGTKTLVKIEITAPPRLNREFGAAPCTQLRMVKAGEPTDCTISYFCIHPASTLRLKSIVKLVLDPASTRPLQFSLICMISPSSDTLISSIPESASHPPFTAGNSAVPWGGSMAVITPADLLRGAGTSLSGGV